MGCNHQPTKVIMAKRVPPPPKKQPWWDQGVQFQCQGSGKCCTSHGEFGHVFFSPEDRKLTAQFLGISEAEFRKQYCTRVEGSWALKEPLNKSPDCLFLKEKRCSIYEARPTQCRTWPFWPEVMQAKAWKKAVVDFCPGVNKGAVISREVIEDTLREQTQNDLDILNES
jgi:uncharacterized protein